MPTPQQPFIAWWRNQSLARQDRYVTLGPLVSVLLFLLAMVLAFWYLRGEEFEREAQSVKRDTEIVQQLMRLHLLENQEDLIRLAKDMAAGTLSIENFPVQANRFASSRAEVTRLVWINAQGTILGRYAQDTLQVEPQDHHNEDFSDALPGTDQLTEPDKVFATLKKSRTTEYSGAYRTAQGQTVFQVQVPLLGPKNAFLGSLIAEYSFDTLVRYFVPNEIATRHMVAVLDVHDNILASTITITPGQVARRAAIVHEVALAPTRSGLKLRTQGYRTSTSLVGKTLFWMLVGLSALTLWMLLGTWQHMRRRAQIQSTLVNETNFRRAMENSMLTGMRAMDLQGRITYVNPAFCAMTGFTETELVGQLPPFPYWPKNNYEENARLLQEELQGRSPAGGIEVKVMHQDGELFDVRMYVSPLIDPKGVQTGWMTSMTNITEAKRVRDQLTASHERFTTVLEGLDAAVSVISVQTGELLFANRSYRVWFGAQPHGHDLLTHEPGQTPSPDLPDDVGDLVDTFGGLPTTELTEAGSQPREVFIESIQKWFDVRTRYLQWTDASLAQMLIATDITSRHDAALQAQQQAEKAQVTSRLVTMGEMASSVAHELNQPLTAISNYCNGMIGRVQNNTLDQHDLIKTLEKTAHQADRAGQIIRRIRAFVKRSEPQRQSTRVEHLVDESVALAEIELRKRRVSLQVDVAKNLPPIMVDPILIEQVLLNLLKNAAEAIDNATAPLVRRHIELQVQRKHSDTEGPCIEFTVTDSGPGLQEDVIHRLYEAFFSTKAEGLGIGLSLCRSIIESHQGRIETENLYNQGTPAGCRFRFTLPVPLAPRP